MRNISAAYYAAALDDAINFLPQVLGISRCEGAETTLTVFWDVGNRRILDVILSARSADVRLWLKSLPEKDNIPIVVIDPVEAFQRAAADALPSSRLAVHHATLKGPIREVSVKLLKQSALQSLQQGGPSFLGGGK